MLNTSLSNWSTYLENNSHSENCDEKAASREQQKSEKQKLKSENGILIAIEQNFIKRVTVEVKDSFRIANIRVHLAVEELLEQVLLLHHIVDIFQGLEWVKINNLITFAYKSSVSTYVIDKRSEEPVDVVIR